MRQRRRSRRSANCCQPASVCLLQSDGDLGKRLVAATADLLAAGHAGAVLVNSDGPTLPRSILRAAGGRGAMWRQCGAQPGARRRLHADRPAKPHPEVFAGIPWSTAGVYEMTLQRACESALAVTNVPAWYDVDDLASLRVLASGARRHSAAVRDAGDDRRRRARDAALPRRARPDNSLTVSHHAEEKTLAFRRNNSM